MEQTLSIEYCWTVKSMVKGGGRVVGAGKGVERRESRKGLEEGIVGLRRAAGDGVVVKRVSSGKWRVFLLAASYNR